MGNRKKCFLVRVDWPECVAVRPNSLQTANALQSPIEEITNMSYQRLQEGATVKHKGMEAILLRRQWAQYAWIIYVGQGNPPETVLADELEVILEDADGVRRNAADVQACIDLSASGGIVDAP